MNIVTRLADRWNSIPAAASLMAAVLLMIGLGVIYQSARGYQEQRVREARVQAEILGAAVTAALDFGDAPAAQESADTLRVNPQVQIAAVFDRDGRLFSGFARGAAVPTRLPDIDAEDGGPIRINSPVISAGVRIGTVHVQSTREPVTRRLVRVTLVTVFVVMAALVVAVLGVAHSALRRANRDLSSANVELTVQMEERAKAEEQLRQAQKMQALGQLTGGIAHDFNNLLTVIQGSADILQRPNLPEEKRARFAAAISQTASRAASLTGQLLAFARRQPLRPETIDLNAQILGMVELLDRTLGEEIAVETMLSPFACVVEADPVQLESAILNIAVNARDAMSEGGVLTIRTAPGDPLPGGSSSIALSISDTGSGIDAEALGRVFEPFFTTKEVGRGTGLGLSQVYGFGTQSGGDVRLDSVPGEGTTVTLLLPRSDKLAPHAQASAGGAPASGLRGGRILVVDDNEEVGAFAEMLLTELGYDVTRARSGEEALDLYAAQRFDAVFTDIVMPGMSGLDLAENLRARRADLPVILTTGFSDRVSEGAARGLPILFKPYKAEALAVALDAALAQRG